MSFLNKLGIGIGSTTSRDVSRPVGANGRPRSSGTPAVGGGVPRAAESHETTRVSNGLKELLWNLLDYLEPTLAKQMVASVTELLRPAGVVFAMFHSKKPEGFQRYRVADSNTLQMISTPVIFPAQKVYQNREIQDLFGRYRTMKSFVSRDQLRETLFIK